MPEAERQLIYDDGTYTIARIPMNWVVKAKGAPPAYYDTIEAAIEDVYRRKVREKLIRGPAKREVRGLIEAISEESRSFRDLRENLRTAIKTAVLTE